MKGWDAMLSIDKSVENAIASVEIEGYKIADIEKLIYIHYTIFVWITKSRGRMLYV